MVNLEQEFLGACISNIEECVPAGRSVGLQPEDFTSELRGRLWYLLCQKYDAGTPVNSSIIAHELDQNVQLLQQLVSSSEESDIHPKEYATQIVTKSLDKQLKQVNPVDLDELSVGEKLAAVRDRLTKIEGRMAQMAKKKLLSPVEALKRSDRFVVWTGIDKIDKLLGWVSGALHFIGGDPGSGKTTLAIQMAVNAAKNGRPVTYMYCEGSETDIAFSILAQETQYPIAALNKMEVNLMKPTDADLEVIGELWDDCVGDLPLSVYGISNGPQQVLSLASSAEPGALVVIDHAKGIVDQGVGDREEHITYASLFGKLEVSARRNNTCTVLMNQYTRAGRQSEERGMESLYGGSSVGNTGSSIAVMQALDSDMSMQGRWRATSFKIVKVRKSVVVDEQGNTINPINQKVTLFIDTRSRTMVSEPSE